MVMIGCLVHCKVTIIFTRITPAVNYVGKFWFLTMWCFSVTYHNFPTFLGKFL